MGSLHSAALKTGKVMFAPVLAGQQAYSYGITPRQRLSSQSKKEKYHNGTLKQGPMVNHGRA
jgi:hypothetical protein